jgi:8-oxo-dGTP diphosphatase
MDKQQKKEYGCLMKEIEVSAAVITRKNNKNTIEIFCAKRHPDEKNPQSETAEKWEFPGGKLEPGEDGATALVREIKEELSVPITVGKRVMTTVHEYRTFRLVMQVYFCSITEGSIVLTEHSDSAWLTAAELTKPDWAPADRPVAQKIQTLLDAKNS